MVTNEVASGGAFENFTNIYMAPVAAFRALKERPTSFLPVILLVLASCAVILWYYSRVDYGWLLERSIDPSRITPEMRKAMASSAAGVVRYITVGGGTIAAGLVVLVVFLVNAGYLSLVSLVTNDGFKFKHWFSLVSWSAMPGLLSQLASCVNLAVSDISHLPQEHINPLSYASLFGLDLAGVGTSTRILGAMDPTALWTLALMATGYHLWTGKGIVSSAMIVAAPLLLFVGLVLVL